MVLIGMEMNVKSVTMTVLSAQVNSLVKNVLTLSTLLMDFASAPITTFKTQITMSAKRKNLNVIGITHKLSMTVVVDLIHVIIAMNLAKYVQIQEWMQKQVLAFIVVMNHTKSKAEDADVLTEQSILVDIAKN